MRFIKRSFFNLLRSPGRTVVIVVMVAISLALGLMMFEVNSAAASQLGAIGGKIGTDITVTPAGYGGLPSWDVILPQSDIAKLKDLAHVASVQGFLQVMYRGSTPLKAASPTYPSTGNVRVTVVQALSVMGVDPSITTPPLMGHSGYVKITMVDGTYLTADDINSDVMVVGQALAEANNIQVGSTVDITGTPVRVIGIYSTGQINNMIIMPITTVQRLYNSQGANEVNVVADNVSNVDIVVKEIKTVFDANTADVLTAQQEYNMINSNLVEAARASRVGMIVTFTVSAAIILLAVFLVMRQRMREIGVMKAIGASNWRIGLGFGIETLFICLASTVLGTCLAIVFVEKGLAGSQVTGISPEIFLAAIVATIALALIASMVPVWYIARVRPAEVLRNE